MTLGIVYFFWFSGHEKLIGVLTPERWGANLTWVAITYLFIQIPTATLTVFTNHLWLAPTLDIGSSVLPVIALVIAFSQWSTAIETWNTEVAFQLLYLTVGEGFISTILTLVVNSRFGYFGGLEERSQ